MEILETHIEELLNLFEEYGMDRVLEENKLDITLKKYLKEKERNVSFEKFKNDVAMWIHFEAQGEDMLAFVNTQKTMKKMDVLQGWEFHPNTLKFFVFPSLLSENSSFVMNGRVDLKVLSSFKEGLKQNIGTEDGEMLFKNFVKPEDYKKFHFLKSFNASEAIEIAIGEFQTEANSLVQSFGKNVPMDDFNTKFDGILKKIHRRKNFTSEFLRLTEQIYNYRKIGKGEKL